MTLTDPHGHHAAGGSLLQASIATEHRSIAQLLTEARRRTPTPGVRPDAVRQLVGTFTAHLHAEETVVHQVAREFLPGRLLGGADRELAELESLLDNLERAPEPEYDTLLERVAEATERHVAAMEGELLPALCEHVPAVVADLGYQYGRAAESSPKMRRAAGGAEAENT